MPPDHQPGYAHGAPVAGPCAAPPRAARPVGPAWAERVQTCLGDHLRPGLPVWCSRSVELEHNHRLLGERLAALLPGVRNRLREGFPATGRERPIYQSAAIVALHGNFARALGGLVADSAVKVPFWAQFETRCDTRSRSTIRALPLDQ